MKELPVPEAAYRDSANSVEMMRAWIAEGALFCSLNIGRYVQEGKVREEDVWGTLFADAMRHVASGLNARYHRSYESALAQMKARLFAELEKPTSTATGEFVGDN